MKKILSGIRGKIRAVITVMILAGAVSAAGISCGGGNPADPDSDPGAFDLGLWKNPPARFRPCFRWWWPGGSVRGDELRRELRLFRDQGFGCVEIQPFAYGLDAADLASDPEIKTVGSDSYFEKVGAACRIAREQGLTVDLTLGSSWSSGGPYIREGRERQLLISSREVSGPASYAGPLPPVEKPKYQGVLEMMTNAMSPFTGAAELVAVTAAKVTSRGPDAVEIGEMTDLSGYLAGGIISWPVPAGDWMVFAFYEGDTGQLAMNPAYPGAHTESVILNHLDRSGVDEMISGFGEPLSGHLREYIGGTLESVFVDSFELAGELPWTSGFGDKFLSSRGYELPPYLPLLFREFGEVKWLEVVGPSRDLFASGELAGRVREDYEAVRSDLFREGFVLPLREWVHRQGLQLRLQNHGGYEDLLEGYGLADVPESEGLYAGGSYDFLKLASSAAHTAGKRYASSESFVALVDDPRVLTREDFYLLAGRAASAGINKIIHHGYPYLYHRTDGSRWYPFDGAYAPTLGMSSTFSSASDETHPVWPDFPELNRYISRLSYALSRGEPRSEIAWLFPDRFFPDETVAFGYQGFFEGQGDSPVTAALKKAGLTYDRINRESLLGAEAVRGRLKIGAADYSALLITELTAAPPELLGVVETLAQEGITVVVLGGLPERVPGLPPAAGPDQEVAAISQRLAREVIRVDNAAGVGTAFSSAGVSPPVLTAQGKAPFLVNRRTLPGGEIILLFNESGQELASPIRLQVPGRKASILNPESGKIVGESAERDSAGCFNLEIRIPPRRSVVIRIEK